MFRVTVSGVGLAVCFAVLSVVFYALNKPETEDQSLHTIESIIKHWNNSISPPTRPFQNLIVGVNSNLDIIVPGVELLRALNVSPGNKKSHEAISNLDELQQTFSLYLGRGSAAERPFIDKRLYHKIVKVAESLEQAQYFIGGNAALIAVKASQLFPKLKIHFVGPVGLMLKKLLPEGISVDPACHMTQDEVHLIMEYKVGEKWGASTAPVANRFVTSFDETNAQMKMLEPLFARVGSSQFDLIVLSGLHMMDVQPADMFNARLDHLVSLLQGVPPSTVTHLEFASMTNANYVKQIVEKVLPNINSLGLNEQELVFASKSCGGPHSDMFDHDGHGQPEIHKISDILMWLMSTYSQTSDRKSRLTRVHFHSLTYHIMAVAPSVWSNTESAVTAGAKVAGLQACQTAELDKDLYYLKTPLTFKLFSGSADIQLDGDNPTSSWERDGVMFYLSPVLVCKHPVKTVGLGDAISASGLMYAQFNSRK